MFPVCERKRLVEGRDGEGFLAADDEDGGELGVGVG